LFETEIREYSIRLVPKEQIYTDVIAFKAKNKHNFGTGVYLNSKPHVTIAGFLLDTQYEENVLLLFKRTLP